MSTINVTDADFQEKVLQSEKPVIVDFWAEWCGPCRQLGPVVDQLAEEYADKVTVAKVDIDANPRVASDYGITSIPLVMVFKDGQKVAESLGARPKAQLEQAFAEYLK